MAAATELARKLRQQTDKKVSKTVADYRALVVKVVEQEALGHEIDPEEAGAIMAAAGKSGEDLEADVALLAKRRELREAIDTAAQAEKQRLPLSEKMIAVAKAHQQKKQALLEKLEAAFNAEHGEMQRKMNHLRQLSQAAGEAKRQLMSEFAPRELRAEMADLQRQLDGAKHAAGFASNETDQARHDDTASRLIAKLNELRQQCLNVA